MEKGSSADPKPRSLERDLGYLVSEAQFMPDKYQFISSL